MSNWVKITFNEVGIDTLDLRYCFQKFSELAMILEYLQ
jgi:hypothetical protein